MVFCPAARPTKTLEDGVGNVQFALELEEGKSELCLNFLRKGQQVQ